MCGSVEDAYRDCESGKTIMVGGFGLSGIPQSSIENVRIVDSIRDLKIISTEASDYSLGLGRLYEKNKIAKW